MRFNICLKSILLLTSLTIYYVPHAQTKHSNDDDRTIKIPVIIHIIYSDEVYEPSEKNLLTSDNLSYEIIAKELIDLNLDYSAKNDMSKLDEDLEVKIGNPNIQFYLADTTFNLEDSIGINRIYNQNGGSAEGIYNESKPINPNKYYNIYIGNMGSAATINGDKVRINFKKVGIGFHSITHETGHYLGLYHTWGRVGTCYNNPFVRDDYVDDTPPQKKCTDRNFSKKNCPPNRKLIKKASLKGKKAMYNNFMDYSGCRCLFTEKQVIRLRNGIIDSRNQMYTSSK